VVQRLILDDMLPHALAEELRARGRAAVTLAELGMAGATDEEVRALDGVLVTTVPQPDAVVVAGNLREAVHRHAHVLAKGRSRRFVG
jgi:hypothetical protein